MFLKLYFCFLDKQQARHFVEDYILTCQHLVFPLFPIFASSTALTSTSKAPFKLTFLHHFGIKNLNALAYLVEKCYLCVEMSGKGSISRMSDECLMKGKSVLPYFGEYQAGMRKFTLARKAL